MVGTIYFAKVNTVPCMCAATLSFRTASRWLDSLAYVESITDAYSQYFVNDIEHTENIKQCQKCNNLLSASAWPS